jgi:hypothetical protein
MREDNALEEWQSGTWRHLTTHDTNSLIMRSTVLQKEKSICQLYNDIVQIKPVNYLESHQTCDIDILC